MAQIDVKQADAPDPDHKLRFEGIVEVGGAVSGEMLSVLFAETSNVNGKLQFQGAVQIDGTFSGAVTTTDRLIVGERAKIQAEITCGSAVVKGEVVGNITASESVDLLASARVRGDITSPSLTVERGAMFDGASRSHNPATKARRPGRS
jgi:cytoskeletal protein CcmA (bactofilin family)